MSDENTIDEAALPPVAGSVVWNKAFVTVTFELPTTAEPTDRYGALEQFFRDKPGHFKSYLTDVVASVHPQNVKGDSRRAGSPNQLDG